MGMNLLSKLWKWLSWGKELPSNSEVTTPPMWNQSTPMGDMERKQRLKAEILNKVSQGYSLQLEQDFVAILNYPRRKRFILYLLVNIPFLVLFGLLWLPVFLLWTILFLRQFFNPKPKIYRLEVKNSGALIFEPANGSTFLWQGEVKNQ